MSLVPYEGGDNIREKWFDITMDCQGQFWCVSH
jgi:hypothetical protein